MKTQIIFIKCEREVFTNIHQALKRPREYYKQLYANECNNLDEIVKSLER